MLKSVLLKSKVRKLFPAVGIIALFLGVAVITYPQSANLKIGQVDKETLFADKTYASFEKLAKEKGVEAAYNLLKERFPNNETAAHDFAHVVGLVSFEKKGASGLSYCDSAYNYGCYHGFIEGFLVKKGPEAIVEIEKSCLALGSVHAPSCLHGIGHGVLAYRSYKLKEALMDCDILKENVRIYCWDGVFMERVTGTMQDPKDRLKLAEENLNEPCDKIDYLYKKHCWRNQVTAWFIYYQNNPQKVGQRCHQIEPEFQDVCFENIGFTNVMNAGENRDLLVGWCQIENGRISDPCIIGEMQELLFEGKSPQLAQSLCLVVSSQGQQNCHQQFQLHFSQYQVRFGQER